MFVFLWESFPIQPSDPADPRSQITHPQPKPPPAFLNLHLLISLLSFLFPTTTPFLQPSRVVLPCPSPRGLSHSTITATQATRPMATCSLLRNFATSDCRFGFRPLGYVDVLGGTLATSTAAIGSSPKKKLSSAADLSLQTHTAVVMSSNWHQPTAAIPMTTVGSG